MQRLVLLAAAAATALHLSDFIRSHRLCDERPARTELRKVQEGGPVGHEEANQGLGQTHGHQRNDHAVIGP